MDQLSAARLGPLFTLQFKFFLNTIYREILRVLTQYTDLNSENMLRFCRFFNKKSWKFFSYYILFSHNNGLKINIFLKIRCLSFTIILTKTKQIFFPTFSATMVKNLYNLNMFLDLKQKNNSKFSLIFIKFSGRNRWNNASNSTVLSTKIIK